jgi:hypothetical protein
MFADESGVTFLSWTNADGKMEGTAQFAAAGDTSSSSSDLVNSSSAQLSGTESDGKISLRIGGSILGTSVSGTIDNSTLVLQVPDSSGGRITSDSFKPATADDFNKKVAALSSHVQDQRNAAASAQADRELASYLDALPVEVSAVQSQSSALVAASSKAQSAVANLKSLTSKAQSSGCFNSSASDQALTAQQESSSAGYDLSSAANDQYSADSDLSTTLGNLRELGALSSKNQKTVDQATSALTAAENAANAADALASNVQSAANDASTAI